jgi:hypothetical protein
VSDVTATAVTYCSIPAERAMAIRAHWPAVWHMINAGRCVVVQVPT